MFLPFFSELVKMLACCILFIAGWMIYTHYKAVKRIKYYQGQGITVYPGFDTFFVGNAP